MDITISTALDLPNLASKCSITVEEEYFFDASFILGCILEERVSKKEKAVLVLHHHGFGHYQGIGSKLGINLQALKDKENLLVVDVMKEIGSKAVETDQQENWLEKALEAVYTETRRFATDQSSASRTTVILEHPGNIAIAFGNIPLVLNYVRLFQGLSSDRISLVCLTKKTASERSLKVLSATMRHCSDLTVTVRGLRTGSANDISGSLKIRRKDSAPEDSKRQSEFHYQLLDKKVRVFAPGTVQFR